MRMIRKRLCRSALVETNRLLVQTSHLSNVFLGLLLEIALSLSDVELVAALTAELVDHSSSFVLGVAAICAFLYAILLIPTKERFGQLHGSVLVVISSIPAIIFILRSPRNISFRLVWCLLTILTGFRVSTC